MKIIQKRFVKSGTPYPFSIINFGRSESKSIVNNNGKHEISSQDRAEKYLGLLLPIIKYHKKRYDIKKDGFSKGWTICGIRFKLWSNGVDFSCGDYPIGKQIKI